MDRDSTYQRPQVWRFRDGVGLDEVEKSLEYGGIEYRDKDHESLEYRGRRFEFNAWANTVVFRDYEEEKVTVEDLEAWKVFSGLVEGDLKVPPE